MLTEVQRLRREVAAVERENESEDEDEDDGPPRGVGMMVTGGILLGPGTLGWTMSGLLATALSSGFCAHCVEETGPDKPSQDGTAFYALAGVTAAAGIALLVIGAHRNTRRRAWQRQRPTKSPGPRLNLGAGGVSLRF